MIGNGGIAGLIAYIIYYLHVNLEIYLIIIVFIAGLTGTARISLNAHKPSEIYTGFLAGFAVMSIVMFLY